LKPSADPQHQKNLEPKWNMNPNAESNIGIGRNTKDVDVDPEDQQANKWIVRSLDTSRATTETVESTEFGKFC
jgi:hypothetical protein